MGIDHVTVTLAHKNGLARDSVVNSFTFRTPGDFIDPLDAGKIEAALNGFYNDVHAPGSASLASKLGVSMSRTVAPIVRHFDVTNDLAGTPAGSPVFMGLLTNLDVNVSANGLPNEMALCLTAAADFGADVEFAPGSRPRARDRGRVYLGPFNTDAMESSGPGSATVPSPGIIDVIVGAGQFLMDDPDTEWVVWSRRAAGVKTVTSAWVDNAWDVQRRRGERPTAKTFTS
jgi:hypothetical protein